jgi:hypothetical protein
MRTSGMPRGIVDSYREMFGAVREKLAILALDRLS